MDSPFSMQCSADSTWQPVCKLIATCADCQYPGFVRTSNCTPMFVEGGPLNPCGTNGLRSIILDTFLSPFSLAGRPQGVSNTHQPKPRMSPGWPERGRKDSSVILSAAKDL